MILRVDQTILDGPTANCMSACIATMFGCPIDDAPILADATWMAVVRRWARFRDYGYVAISVPNEETFLDAFSEGYLIVTGMSLRGRKHATIYRDGKLWHDPHPDRTGIICVEEVDFFYPLSGPRPHYG